MKNRVKGKSVLLFPDDYVMIDTETTGLSPDWDRVLEISALKVHKGKILQEYSNLIKYSEEDTVPPFVTDLTGITTDQIRLNGVSPKIAISKLRELIGSDLIVGYNINYDLNFLYDLYQQFDLGNLNNDYIDILRIARRFFKGERHNRVQDVLPRLGITHSQQHRALADCYDQKSILDELRSRADPNIFVPTRKVGLDLRKLSGNSEKQNPNSTFYMKSVCFTGALSIQRKEAAQIIVDLGGIAQNGVNKKTDYLIVGDTSYTSSIKNGVTGKQKRAQELMTAGQDINILTESLFMQILEEENA
ncbi:MULTISPECIES: exonuclease domain-containing protein [Lacticaseibacillus]|uniref:exonuclease domain-containing protein n=1 Tax=Lacticaseibacillus TaxID=2759736 RepID=UPI00063DC0DD|nr:MULTISPECIES: exonuclease domain-containing protein [Lacticaseibacillus]KLI74895.1 hypothetical protein AAW28_12695 [Lacticaseibacillus casei]